MYVWYATLLSARQIFHLKCLFDCITPPPHTHTQLYHYPPPHTYLYHYPPHTTHHQVMQVSTKENQGDELKWVKFSSIAWTHDNKGFFYQVSLHGSLIANKTLATSMHYFCLFVCNCTSVYYAWYTNHIQRYPEVVTESEGTETTQVLDHKVSCPTTASLWPLLYCDYHTHICLIRQK